jgi:3-phenylpropionate/cinnamic acid dioxygenase small subunit
MPLPESTVKSEQMAVSVETELEIQRFLAYEAKLLDDNALEQWLDLLSEDVHYFMPVRETIPKGRERPSSEATFALFDDDKSSIRLRTRRILSNVAPTESPPPLTQRLITNILIDPNDNADEYNVRSNFLVHIERRGRHVSMFIGSREDKLRRTGEGWKIARRRVLLAQTVLPMTISIFL